MGKKRIIKKGGAEGSETEKGTSSRPASRKIDKGVLYVLSTYNNTKVALTDTNGNLIIASSSGSLGFSGAKKGTPFAAAKVGETVGLKALDAGVKEVAVVIKGVGSGRESAVRGFVSKGFGISSIKDATPVPHNGPRPKKPRRV